jgi:hypothetical protein
LAKESSIWRAILATSSKPGYRSTGRSDKTKPIYNTKGEVVAENRAKLWLQEPKLNTTISYNQYGVAKASLIASGALADGSYAAPACNDWSDINSVVGLGQGDPRLNDKGWISGQTGLSCQTPNIYCIGERVAALTPTPTISPTATPTEAPTDTPTDIPSNTPTDTPTPMPTEPLAVIDTPVPNQQPANTPNTDSTPQISPTANPTPPNISIPVAPSTPAPNRKRSIPPNTIAGEVTVSGKAYPGALVYIPELVEVALTDKDGFFSFFGVDPNQSKVTIMIRSSRLVNGGYDIPARTGLFTQVHPNRVANLNQNGCKERDKLKALYSSATSMRYIYRLANRDHLKFKSKIAGANSSRETGRAISRLFYHASFYLELSSMLPDLQILCPKAKLQCNRVDLREIVRKMKFSAVNARRESLLFNRKLRLSGIRSENESKKIIALIRAKFGRLRAGILKLPRVNYSCRVTTNRIQS